MSFSELARYEWILVELLVLGVLIWQLVSVRRAIRADRAKARAQAAATSKTPQDIVGDPPNG